MHEGYRAGWNDQLPALPGVTPLTVQIREAYASA